MKIPGNNSLAQGVTSIAREAVADFMTATLAGGVCLALVAAAVCLTPVRTLATQTENNTIHIMPASGPVKMDGTLDDWNLSGGIFTCDDVERFRDSYALQFFAMYDKENIYLAAKWKDPTPLNSAQSCNGGYGFAGDCLQVRFITGFNTPREKTSHWDGWLDRDKINVLTAAYGRKFDGGNINGFENGARQAFKIDADGKGYVQQLSIPWKLLTFDGKAPEPGSEIVITLEPNFTAGPGGRITIKDLFREGKSPDRVFAFSNNEGWGVGILEKSGRVKTPPLRLSDGRLFPVKLTPSGLDVDWTGLVKPFELPGFKTISFKMPEKGDVSLIIRNAKGEVVRELLNENSFDKGRHEIKWDGLGNRAYRDPGKPVEPGTYTWEAIAHPPFRLTLRGWAANGGHLPWENGPQSGWGGDHGLPSSVACDGKKIYLGWTEAEAGKALIACDLEGNVKWRINQGAIASSSFRVAIENDVVYNLGRLEGYGGGQVVRLRAADGIFDKWEGSSSAALEIPSLWAGQPDAAAMPRGADGLEVKDGKLYLAFSRQDFYNSSVTDWKALILKLQDAQPLSQRIYSKIDPTTTKRLKEFLEGKLEAKQAFATWNGGPDFAREVEIQIRALIGSGDLVQGSEALSKCEREAVNRKFIESYFGAALLPLKTGFIVVCDARTGKLLKTIPVTLPQSVHALDSKRVVVISAGRSIVEVDTESGVVKTLISDLDEAQDLAIGPDGRLYVSLAGNTQQIKVFDSTGKCVGDIGKQGGRPDAGKWQPDTFRNPQGLAVDAKNGRLWVAENYGNPKRVSAWSLATGRVEKEFFGPTHYGASGGAINPLDPDIMVFGGCEWKLDPQTGRAVCTGTFKQGETFAAFCPIGKRLYVTSIENGPDGVDTMFVHERVAEGDYKLRATWTVDYVSLTTKVWSDANGNEAGDEGETVTLAYPLWMNGGRFEWSMNVNPDTLTVYGWVPSEESARQLHKLWSRKEDDTLTQAVFRKVYQIKRGGETACGAPKWDFDNMKDISYVWGKEYVMTLLPSNDDALLLAVDPRLIACYRLTDGARLWSYPDTFSHVHGSHQAPPPVSGLLRGVFGAIGTFKLPETGTVWVLNGNCGEWYLFTENGHYLGHLFQGDPMKMTYPEKAIPGADMTESPCGGGGEDFGGSVRQGADGKVYIQSGHIATWNVLATGFDKVKRIGQGKITITPADVGLATKQMEMQKQAAVGTKLMSVKKGTPEFKHGNLGDFSGVEAKEFSKSDDTLVRIASSWDAQNLYLGWDVRDVSPWMNTAADPAQMYVCGDTVDFQFGSYPKTDPGRDVAVKGDLRISIGNFQGKPTAVLYRLVSDTKKPKIFSSGVIQTYEMQYVDVLPEARISVKVHGDQKGYLVEAAIPWSALGFTPVEKTKYRGDFGVTYGNEGSTRTMLRNHWNNQETGLVSDVVFELMMHPRNWGEITFE